jgi:hypothetical protein
VFVAFAKSHVLPKTWTQMTEPFAAVTAPATKKLATPV